MRIKNSQSMFQIKLHVINLNWFSLPVPIQFLTQDTIHDKLKIIDWHVCTIRLREVLPHVSVFWRWNQIAVWFPESLCLGRCCLHKLSTLLIFTKPSDHRWWKRLTCPPALMTTCLRVSTSIPICSVAYIVMSWRTGVLRFMANTSFRLNLNRFSFSSSEIQYDSSAARKLWVGRRMKTRDSRRRRPASALSSSHEGLTANFATHMARTNLGVRKIPLLTRCVHLSGSSRKTTPSFWVESWMWAPEIVIHKKTNLHDFLSRGANLAHRQKNSNYSLWGLATELMSLV